MMKLPAVEEGWWGWGHPFITVVLTLKTLKGFDHGSGVAFALFCC